MTTAESTIHEYLERGYSLESLRLLAESRGHPLGGEMLAVLAAMVADGRLSAAEEDSGPCETAAYPVARGEEGSVFFVADDEEAVSGEAAIDFDVMAGTAAGEESVAEVFVGPADIPADIPAAPPAENGADAEAPERADGQAPEDAPESGEFAEDIGIWSRLWSRVSGGKTPALAPSVREGAGSGSLLFEEDSVAETPAEPVAGGDAAPAEISADYIPGSISDLYDVPPESELAETSEDPVAENGDAAADEPIAEPACEPCAALADDPVVAAPPEPLSEPAAEADASVSILDELRRLGEAQAVLAASQPETPSELAAAEITTEAEAATTDAAEDAALPSVPSPARDEEEAGITRRERRRRERAEKKLRKRGKQASATDSLPEIVLARSEGTESLTMVEDAAARERVEAATPESAASASESASATATEEEAPAVAHLPALPSPVAETAAEDAVAEDESAEANAPRMSEPMSLLTPNDIIEDDAQESSNNVILFSEKFPVFAGIAASADDDEDDDEQAAGRCLRMLPPVDSDEEEEYAALSDAADLAADFALQIAQPDAPGEEAPADGALPLLMAGMADAEAEAPRGDGADDIHDDVRGEAPADVLDDETRRALARAMLGVGDACPGGGADDLAASGADGHVIVALEPEAEPVDALAREAEVRAEMEMEYQSRLDDFALRLLEAQARTAAHEALVRDKDAELAAREAALGDMRSRLDEEAERRETLAGALETTKTRVREREQELERFTGMREEHERLYKEFEDLRRAYNEVVTDVMPGLQNERDDLALTVERQCEGEEKLRSSLGSMKKRLAVGYSLGAAACLTLIALPVANWMKSGEDERELAARRQEMSDLQETLQRETRRNIDAQNVIVELENKVTVARAQIADLQGKNKELARVSRQQQSRRDQGLAVFQPAESGAAGVPVRASDMALQATTQPGGRLRVNEIRDPAGSIEQVAALNRQQQSTRPDGRLAASAPGASGRSIPMSAVARVEGRPAPGGGGTLRPGTMMAAAAADRPAAPVTAREGETLAKVKKGEGVAQVVYRELGTWDPEVVAWVIRENKIPLDKRGNPRIHPDQTLRLPGGGRVGQAASAAGARKKR